MDAHPSSADDRAGPAMLAAVLLLAASGLLFELTLTRIFSATIWYHYAFVAISVALFGWGLGGFLVYLLGFAGRRGASITLLIVLALLTSAALPLFPFGILRFPFTPERLNTYFLLSLLPFLAGGAALSLAFEARGRDANRLYFADLVGAAAGVLAVPLAISRLGAETTVLATAVLPAAAALLLAVFETRGRARLAWATVSAAAVAGHVGLTSWNLAGSRLTVRDAPEKAMYKLLAAHPQARVVSDRWNAYSRITVVEGFDDFHLARLFIDSDAETSVLPWNGRPDTPGHAREWFRAFPFRLADRPEVMVIGPGGGTDVVMAIACGSPRVTAVELNPLIVDAVRRLGDRAGNLYDHPQVELVMSEGRNFVERTDRRFDLIVLGFVDSWASVASGGLSLTENYLYTREALEAYYDRLTDRGALVIIRWPVDVPRLAANAVDFLSARGLAMEDIGRRMLAVSARRPASEETSNVETVFMLTRSPLDEAAVERLLAGHPEAHVIHAPYRAGEPQYADLFAGRMSFADYTQMFPTLATPVNDDHPFYFAVDKPLGIPDFMARLLALPVAAVLGFALLLLAGGRILGFPAPAPRTVAYFGALGVGFIVCEIALLQRLILLLGHPIYTLVIILFTLLTTGSLGSLFARRFPPQRIGRVLGGVIPAVILLVLAGAFLLPAAVRAALPLELPVRIVLTAAMVAPFGFLMGMPFPLGLRSQALEAGGAPISALWGINGVASVVGSIGAVALAVAFGFTWVFVVGAACYALAWLTRPGPRG